MLDKWLTERYPLFRRNHDGNRAMLAELVEASRERGFYPVLVDLPLDLEIAGDRLDEPRADLPGGLPQGRRQEAGIPFCSPSSTTSAS